MASNASDRDASVAQFITMTGASTDVARHTLEACNWNLALAVNMFFMDSSPRAKTAPAPANRPSVKTNHSVGSDSGSGRNVKQNVPPPDDDDVRAPIAPIKEVLVNDYSFGGGGGPGAFYANIRAQQTVEGQRTTNPAAEPITAFDALFAPPVELIFNGNFELLKKAGEQQKKWLLVNIQSTREFECQVLNRDVWSNRNVKTLIAQHFLFWQLNYNSVEGNKYVTFYNVSQYPHISIIDPRTGEKLLTWNKATAKSLCDELTKFVAVNPSPGTSTAPVTQVTSPSKSHSIYEQSEEAQLKAAIEASLSSKTNGNNILSAKPKKDGTSPGAWKQYLGPDGGKKVQLVIRLPDGKCNKATFPAGTKVKALLLYISEQFDLNMADFDVLTTFPKKSITSDEMASLEAAGVQARDTLYLQHK